MTRYLLALTVFLGGCAAQAYHVEPDCEGFVPVPYKGWYLCAAPDYYQEAGVRKPMGLVEAENLAIRNGYVLPTRDMVDAIWQHADLKLTPVPMTPDANMSTVGVYERHNDIIETQIGVKKFQLVAGHKKDIIQPQRNGRVTIYGWHRENGKPIQGVSSVHSENYYDYSHGLRFVFIP